MEKREFIDACKVVGKGIGQILVQFLPADEEKWTVDEIIRRYDCHPNTVSNRMRGIAYCDKIGSKKRWWADDVRKQFGGK